MKKRCLLSLVLVVFCLTSFPEAHDIVLIPVLSDGSVRLTMKYGEPGSYLLTTKEKVLALDVYDPAGTMKSWAGSIAADGDFLVAAAPVGSPPTPGSWMFVATYDNGYTVVMPDGTRRRPAAGEKGIHFLRFGKALVADALDRSLISQLVVSLPTDARLVASGSVIGKKSSAACRYDSL